MGKIIKKIDWHKTFVKREKVYESRMHVKQLQAQKDKFQAWSGKWTQGKHVQ